MCTKHMVNRLLNVFVCPQIRDQNLHCISQSIWVSAHTRVNLRWTSVPSRGVNGFNQLCSTETRISTSLMCLYTTKKDLINLSQNYSSPILLIPLILFRDIFTKMTFKKKIDEFLIFFMI